jgi:hypothetical protein
METMSEIVRIVAATTPFIVMLMLSKKVNVHAADRACQYSLPMVAFIYGTVAIVLAERINSWLVSVVDLIGQFIPYVGSFNTAKWLNYIFNAAIVAAFLIIKAILLPLISTIWKRMLKLSQKTEGVFYEQDELYELWALKEKYGQAKSLWCGIYWGAVGISSVILGLSQLYPSAPFFQVPFYPAFGVLVLGEIWFFLSGLTRQEYASTIAGDDDVSKRVANYGMLRGIYSDLFPERILYDSTADSLSGLSSFDTLEKLTDGDNALNEVISHYFADLKEKGQSIDPGFVRASIDMVQGKSVVLNTPFYHDLTAYIVLPLVRRLLSFEKALIVVGRDSATEDVLKWLDDGMVAFCGTADLWKAGMLSERNEELDVGVLRFADIYNRNVLDANDCFLKKVGFVLLIEPSRLIATGQIGIANILCRIDTDNKKIVYCFCDRNCDGLVDALSQLLKVSLTEVYATVPTLASCACMYWNAHGEPMHHQIFSGIAHYLGVGTELSAVALRNQVAQTMWVGGDRFPVRDIHWIVRTYFSTICRYIGYQQSQEALAEVFKVDANLWNLRAQENTFISVEDEFFNLFEMSRLYSTRARNEGFVNVISENYLLREYMVDNAAIFSVDPKIIPSIVPDYARTERNTVIALVMRMMGGSVKEADIRHEFNLVGIDCKDVGETLAKLIDRHCGVKNVELVRHFDRTVATHDDYIRENIECFSIGEKDKEMAAYFRKLTNAYFIIENDRDKSNYSGAMLYGHIFQMYLPGQYLTFAGKYYEVKAMTAENGIVLTRASDHINDRVCYRQRRAYELDVFKLEEKMGAYHTGRGIEFFRGFCDVFVDTIGYFELHSYDNLASAHEVVMHGENVKDIERRIYRNKMVLCIKLEGTSEKTRFTIALLLNEIFRTLFPESYHYVNALVVLPENEESNLVRMANSLKLSNMKGDDAIYIVEDSEIDLGLLVSIDRALVRILEIVADYIAWFNEKTADIDLYKRIEEAALDYADSNDCKGGAGDIDVDSETEADADEIVVEETPSEETLLPEKYGKNFYLLFGYNHLDPLLDFENALKYFTKHGFDNNALKLARKSVDLAKQRHQDNQVNRKDVHYCDFCACELLGGEFDVLADGRERCTQCSKSALKTEEQFRRLYEKVKKNMEAFFAISLNMPITVRMVNAKKIAQLCGVELKPSPLYEGRILAFAEADAEGYTIYIENGAPKIAAVANIAHELTHIWQFANLDIKEIMNIYPDNSEDYMLEGMAKWVEIQYLCLLNEVSYAKRQEAYTRSRTDAYGEGFKAFAERYPLKYEPGHIKDTPFASKEQLLG